MKTKRLTVTLLLVAVLALSFAGVVGLYHIDLAYAADNGETRTVDFYAINDFHGKYERLAQVSGYIADKLDNGNTVAINSGDMFQGSIQSNSNYGKLFSECMDVAGFDSFTFGNHEFDWGLDNLRELAANSNVPFLGANIYNGYYDNARSTWIWEDFAEDLAQEYVIKELDNGLRIGIIGVIGKDQITSISSQLVQTIGFKNPLPIIERLSAELRNNQNCDIVVVSAHTGPETFLNDKSYDITTMGVDAVFCAHTHAAEIYESNGVPFIQGGNKGDYVSHIQLSVDNSGKVSLNVSENISYSALPSNEINQTVYNEVQTKINNSNEQIADEANRELATLTGGYLNSSTNVPRLVCNAIADYAVSQGYRIELVIVNNARNKLQGTVDYSALYEAIPFDNVVYIAEVSGKDILNEVGYSSNSIWRVTGNPIKNTNERYLIAVIDYLLYHQNSSREYNYFPSAFTGNFEPIPLTKQGETIYNYRLITRDYLLKQGTVDVSIYSDYNLSLHTDKSLLEQRVDLPVYTDAQEPIYFYVLGVEGVVILALVVVLIVVIARRRKSKKA